jgi:hypothetical protein
MTESSSVTGITNSLAKATLGDGTIPTNIKLSNNMRPKAAITSLTTMFEVVWYKAQRNIWLQYASRDRAIAARDALQGKQIAGVHVRCQFTQYHQPQPHHFGVKLENMPEDVVLSDIRPRLPNGENPDGLAYGNLSYPSNTDALHHICGKIFARTNERIKYRKLITVKSSVKQKAEITLHADAANLAVHANALNGIVITELGHSKVFFVERLRLYIAIESEFYKRRSKTLKGIADRAWNTHHVEVKIFDGELRYAQNTFLTLITGNGRAAVQQVKAEIDECVAEYAIRGLQRQAGVPKQRCYIHLNTVSEFRKAVADGGLERLKKFYGDGTIVFEEELDPPRITINARDGKLEKAKDVLFRTHPKGSDVGECPVCTEDSVELLKAPGCTHQSCRECLDDYCSINSSDHLPLKCFSDLECGTIFPIRWLKEHLSPVTYRSLFENAIAGRCRQDLEAFVHCDGQECNQYLATIKGVNKIICPKCITVNCTSCRTQYHFGETCEESQGRRDPHEAALDQYLAEIGGKLCPRCNTPGVRVEGCFHIECPSCKVHYCWLCLAHFETMGEAYGHMDRAHGGPFGGRLGEQERMRMEQEWLGEGVESESDDDDETVFNEVR